MKKLTSIIAFCILNFSWLHAQEYTAAKENMEARHQFQEQKQEITISTEGIATDGPDTVILVELK